jgi:hypothetical protein
VRQRLSLILAATVTMLAAAPAAPAQQVSLGISDQEASTFFHPLFLWTGITRARLVVRWDIALAGHATTRERLAVDQWLNTARGLYIEPFVSLQRPRDEDCRRGPCRLPTAEEYRAALTAFHRRYPWVKAISPWNEANHPSQPTAAHPEAAAAYYEIARSVCPDCRVVGAELLDIGNMERWLRAFRAALPSQPRLWALHNYGDVTRAEDTLTLRLLQAVEGEVWVTETGGLVRFEMADGAVAWPYDEQRARRSVDYAFALADAHPDRITRLYLYNWRSPPWQLWDSALLNFAGEPRPSFLALAARLRPGVPVPTAAAIRPARAWVARRPRLGRDRRVRATLACNAERSRFCDVAMGVRTRRGRRIGDAVRAIRGGRFRVLRVRLSRKQVRRLTRGRRCRVRARVWVGARAPLRFRVRCPARR